MADEDEGFYRGILQGDAACLEAALQKFAPRIMGVMWRDINPYGSSEDLKDLLQEVAIRMWFNISTYDPSRVGTTFYAWVRQLARTVSGEYARKQRRRQHLLSISGVMIAANPESPEETWGREIDTKKLRVTLSIALNKLPPAEAGAMRMYLEGLTNLEIAKRMNVDPGAVRTRLSRGRAKLIRALNPPKSGSPRSTNARSR
jgi:RNA polymerase sigma-70 factor (ECF subfamily)